jgi:catechol 2,3-dioxygenase-like lactoylglutathione lyase family enzyme
VTIRRAIPIVTTQDPTGTRRFYEDFLGFRVAMEEDGLLMLASPSVPTTQVIIAWASPSAMDPAVADVDVSIEVEDVEGAYDEARARGLDVVYPLTDEPWGVRRFFVRDPSGRTVNVASHRPADPPGGGPPAAGGPPSPPTT